MLLRMSSVDWERLGDRGKEQDIHGKRPATGGNRKKSMQTSRSVDERCGVGCGMDFQHERARNVSDSVFFHTFALAVARLIAVARCSLGIKKELFSPSTLEPLRVFQSLPRLCAVYLCALCILAPNVGRAQLIGTNLTYDERLRGARNVGALDETLFGDKINLQDGRVVFEQDDVVLATNSALKVQIGRRTPPGSRGRDMAFSSQGLDREFAVFGIGWELNVPYMMGTYDERVARFNKCSTGDFVPNVQQPSILPYEADPLEAGTFWNGIRINIPGQGEEQLLKLNSDQTLPADGKTYVGTTRTSWRARCLSSIKNGPGEGFAVVLPDGTTYYFDWMAIRDAVDLTMNGTTDVNGDYWDYADLLMPLVDVFLYATRVEDRFGNFVSYTYDANHPNRIKSIESSDGVRLDVEYNTSGQIYKVKSGDRTWTYTYETIAADNGFKRLSSIELPDRSKWSFSFQWRTAPTLEGNFWKNCAADPDFLPSNPPIDPARFSVMTMTHPSGAKGEFKFLRLFHGSNNTPGSCQQYTTWSNSHPGLRWWGTEDVPSAYAEDSLYEKKISGSGIPNLAWNYKYYPSWSFTYQCGAGCPTTSQTTVQASDGVLRRYTFGNSYSSNFGQLLTETVEKNGVVHLAKSYTYLASASGQPFPDNTGFGFGNPFTFRNRPLRIATTQLDGVTFKRSVNTFDSFVRPVSVTKYNSIGYAITDTTTYHDNLSLWALGQVKSVTNVETGLIVSQTDYDATYALPIKNHRFHVLKETLAYNTAGTVASGQRGTLASVTDGRGNTTSVSSWKRGIPQKITHADGKLQSGVVNNDGTLASVTDENGYKTCYAYDAMGRLNKITYPSETQVGICDTSAWNPTTITFAAGNPAAYGVPAGHWRQTTLTGRGRKVTIFDALWRPILEQTLDLDNVDPTLSVAVKRYDVAGRPVFQSYPMATLGNYAATTLKGTHTTYDALDRPTYIKQDSELDLNLDGTTDALTTRTEYLYNADGYYTKVTNPRGEITRTWYQAFDQPSYDAPVKITHPESVTTHIYRDVFGKTTAIKRSGGGVTATRHYLYGGAQRLCMVTEPETGSMVVWYDGADNLSGSASGLNIPVGTSCPDAKAQAAASGRLVNRSYDVRNRITSLRFPDGRGNTTHTYTPDGLPATIAADNGGGDVVTTTYTYDKRRMMRSERLQWDVVNWTINYAYNANGHLAAKSWHGLTVDYAPNSLGQPTRAGTYATNVQYNPNGAIKQFTYGNGIVHTLNQNVRGLPDRSRDAYGSVAVHDDSLDYDANGNVAAISDGLAGARGNRDMTYDGLDRLKTTISPMYGAMNAHYSYDALDNLTRVKIGGAGLRDHWYCYDSKWRLTNIKTVSCSGTTVVGLGYDVQGNVNNKNGVTYNFDYGNRLRSVTGSPASSYLYDGHGRRILDTTSAKKHSQYAASGELSLTVDQRRHVVSEYIHLGSSLVAIRERDATTNTYSTKYQHTDALGSPVAVTNESRTVVERNEYEPYGKVLNHSLKDGPGYTGHVADAATGLIYAQQRYYDDDIGRLLSVDPVTADSGTGGNFNRYWYANNNPYRFVDPDGRQSLGHQENLPFWDIPGHIGNWFAETRDLSVDVAYGARIASDGALIEQYEQAGNAILFVQSAALPGMGVGASTGRKAATGLMQHLVSPKEVERLVALGGREASNGVSAALRKLTSHAQRQGGTFKEPVGSLTQKNQQALDQIRGILTHPKVTRTELRNGFEYRVGKEGQGVRFNSDGAFNTFLDPRLK